MKASNIVLTICCCLSLGYWLYTKYFSTASKVYDRISQVQQGMSQQQVSAVLSAPDSVYWEMSDGDSLLVMHYNPDADSLGELQVVLRDDSVRAIKFHQ